MECGGTNSSEECMHRPHLVGRRCHRSRTCQPRRPRTAEGTAGPGICAPWRRPACGNGKLTHTWSNHCSVLCCLWRLLLKTSDHGGTHGRANAAARTQCACCSGARRADPTCPWTPQLNLGRPPTFWGAFSSPIGSPSQQQTIVLSARRGHAAGSACSGVRHSASRRRGHAHAAGNPLGDERRGSRRVRVGVERSLQVGM